MFPLRTRVRRGFRLLPLLVALAIVVPLFAAPVLAGCCLGASPCCPGDMEANGATTSPAATTLSGPVPPCCQTLLPAAPPASGRQGAAPPPVVIALDSQPAPAPAALPCAGRVAAREARSSMDPPAESASARAPPAR
jgi:hypothetical protein